MKLTSRRAALLLAGSTLALAAGVLPAQAASSASTGWRTDATVAVKGKTVVLSGIDAVSARDAWAAGGAIASSGKISAGLIEHWSGRAWRSVTLPRSIAKDWNASASFPVIGASSGTNVWAFGELPGGATGDRYFRLNGTRWTTGTLPGTSLRSGKVVIMTAVQATSSTDVWAFGGQESASSSAVTFSPYAAHFNGKRWKTYSVPGTGAITAASEISSGNISAVLGVPLLFTANTTAVPPVVVRWNGSTWATAADQPSGLPTGANLTSILATGGKVWIGGGATNSKGGTSEFAAELTGSTWTLGGLSAPTSTANFYLTDLVSDGSGGVWGLAESNELAKPRLWHLSSAAAASWTSASASFGKSHQALFQLAHVPGSKSVWGAGVVQRGAAVDGLFALYGATPR